MAKIKTVALTDIYGAQALERQAVRYKEAVSAYEQHFGANGNQYRFFSVPGRTEICGNHTEHNNGKVIAASVNLDIIAVVEPIEVDKIVIKSKGLDEVGVWLDNVEYNEEEKGTATALIKGIVKGLRSRGFKIGGFKAYTMSAVPIGSGLSSSASFEVLIGLVLSCLYNDGNIDPIKIAKAGRYAEDVYYGKCGGLTDQAACANGGFVAIDFKDENAPVVQNINFNFNACGHYMCIVDTNGKLENLSDEYTAIAEEMNRVAAYYGVKKLRQISREDILLNISELRQEVGDRAVLRALHFFSENDRVSEMIYALKEENFDDFLQLVYNSGSSSYKYLQNVYSSLDVTKQDLAICLNIAQLILNNKGAVRIHGGGFSGSIQAFVPNDLAKRFKLQMERIFGAGSCHTLTIRSLGAVEVTL